MSPARPPSLNSAVDVSAGEAGRTRSSSRTRPPIASCPAAPAASRAAAPPARADRPRRCPRRPRAGSVEAGHAPPPTATHGDGSTVPSAPSSSSAPSRQPGIVTDSATRSGCSSSTSASRSRAGVSAPSASTSQPSASRKSAIIRAPSACRSPVGQATTASRPPTGAVRMRAASIAITPSLIPVTKCSCATETSPSAHSSPNAFERGAQHLEVQRRGIGAVLQGPVDDRPRAVGVARHQGVHERLPDGVELGCGRRWCHVLRADSYRSPGPSGTASAPSRRTNGSSTSAKAASVASPHGGSGPSAASAAAACSAAAIPTGPSKVEAT